MDMPPAVIVHSLRHCAAALAPGRPVTLLSAPGAASYAGCAWWAGMLRAAGADYALLDCGQAPGRALEALKLGLKGIVLDCEPGQFSQLAAIATENGAIMLPAPPLALDMANRNASRNLNEWLMQH